MKIYRLKDPDKKGFYRISLVDEPAVQTQLMAFNKEKETLHQFLNEDKMEVYAPALIPNKLMFRKNINGEPAQVYFEAEDIKQLHINGSRLNYDNRINLNHEELDTEGIFCFESWIVLNKENDKASAMGFDVPEGTLMKGYKIDNQEVWDKIKSGKITGLSIEAFLQPEETNDNINLNFENMNKKTLLGLMFSAIKEKFSFADSKEFATGFYGTTLDEGAIITDAEGNPLADATFEYEGKKYMTDEVGAIKTIEDIQPDGGGDSGDSEKDARILELETENADLKAQISQMEDVKLSNETLAKEVEAVKLSNEKLTDELIQAKKIKLTKEAPKSYEEMTNKEKLKYNRENF